MGRRIIRFIFLCLAISFFSPQFVFPQLSYEVFTDKETYSYGESIILTGRIYNHSDSTVTFISNTESFISPYLFNDAVFTGPALPLDVPYYLPAKSWYTCCYTIDPIQMGLPNSDGINRIISHISWYFYPVYNGFSATDTVEFSAPAFYGGQLEVNYSVDSSNTVATLRDSMNAYVLKSDTSFYSGTVLELWQTSGFILDSLVDWYINNPCFIEIYPCRDLAWPSKFVTSIHKQEEYPLAPILTQNYPNPFNLATTIEYDLYKQTEVRLSVFNVSGQLIEIVVSDQQEPGTHKVRWDARARPSGIYFYRLQTSDFNQTKKMILIQ